MAKTIMVVDDSATMRLSLKLALELSGFKVESAGDGVMALNLLKVGPKPDLIITDINMPNMGGLEFIKNLRTLPGFRFIPVLALTTESKQEKRDEAKKYGATGWLVKPVTGPELVKVIKQVLPGA
ncbi:MAG: response regulator [Desulfobulbaceae bacterium]|jgi:two-component system chemotaxis response regulator CheY|nr:response regulator [Desulfobulbaceae bacterium]